MFLTKLILIDWNQITPEFTPIAHHNRWINIYWWYFLLHVVKLFSEDKDEIRKTFKPECRIFVLVDEEDAPWQKKKKREKGARGISSRWKTWKSSLKASRNWTIKSSNTALRFDQSGCCSHELFQYKLGSFISQVKLPKFKVFFQSLFHKKKKKQVSRAITVVLFVTAYCH